MDELREMVLPVLGTILTFATPLLVAYVVRYLHKQLRKVGLEATAQELETLKSIVTEAVFYAAQKAKVAGKNGGKKATSAEKKAFAMGFAKKLAEKYGVDEAAIEMMDDILEAQLGAREDL